MGDKIKRTADNQVIDHNFADWAPKVWDPPKCHCGEPATFEVNLHTRVEFYCTPHLPADALGEHKR
jgi:hypothetical protein